MTLDCRLLRNQLERERGCGSVHLDIVARQNGCSDALAMEAVAKRAGFLNAPRDEIDRSTAVHIAVEMLSRDLAHGTECIPRQIAHQHVECLLSAFGADARFFTNARFEGRDSRMSSWNPLTNATFDSGFFAVDARSVGLIWVEDED